MGLGGVGLRVRELITELILKKVPQNKVSNTADQNTFWRYFRGGGGGAYNRINSKESV